MVPAPVDAIRLPVELLPSGGTELKFHCVMLTCAEAVKPQTAKANAKLSLVTVLCINGFLNYKASLCRLRVFELNENAVLPEC
jgi:hypothetical protein